MASNPNPSRVTDVMWNFWERFHAIEPSVQLGGFYAFKRGYHSTRLDNIRNWPGNYSILDWIDKQGPGDKSSAIDLTFPEAQRGDYSRISKYCRRLMASSQDPNDPRLNGLREWYGQDDADSAVEGWDNRYNRPATSDSSHLWHIHISFSRGLVNDSHTFNAVLSVLKGETLAQWSGTSTTSTKRTRRPEMSELKPGFAYDVSGDNRIDPKAVTVKSFEWTGKSFIGSFGKGSVSLGMHYDGPTLKFRVEAVLRDEKTGDEWFKRLDDIVLRPGLRNDWRHLPVGSYGVLVGRIPVSKEDTNDDWPVDLGLTFDVV